MNRFFDRILNQRFSIYVTSLILILAVFGNDSLREMSAPYLERISRQKIINPRLKSKDKYVLAKEKGALIHRGFRNGNIKMVHRVGGTFHTVSLGNSFTVEVIIKPSRDQVNFSHIIGNHPGYKYFEGFAIQQDGDNQNVYTFGFGNGKRWLPSVRFELPPEKWSYLAIVVKRNMIGVFRNGSLIVSADATDSIKNSEMPVQVGNWINHDRPFKGCVFEVRILDYALDETDLGQNWQLIKVKLT